MPRRPEGLLYGFASFLGRRFLLVCLCLLLVMVLARTDNWFFRNEVFAWLGSGIAVDADHPSLSLFRAAAVDNCGPEGPPDASVCRDYQGAYAKQKPYIRPIHTLFATILLASYGERPWLDDLHRAAIGSLLAGGVLAVCLWLLLVLALPRDLRIAAAALPTQRSGKAIL